MGSSSLALGKGQRWHRSHKISGKRVLSPRETALQAASHAGNRHLDARGKLLPVLWMKGHEKNPLTLPQPKAHLPCARGFTTLQILPIGNAGTER